MGDQDVKALSDVAKQDFLRHLLDDIRSLDRMIEDGQIESGITRIGAEQECCLIGADCRPAMTGPEILAAIPDPHFTSELARWNLEINLDPQDFGAGCFTKMHEQLRGLLRDGSKYAAEHHSRMVLTGILPSIRQSDLDFRFMTPNPRYRLLDSILKKMRGEHFWLNIEGVDEINLRHDSILFEACNTSFQIHLQIDPADFVDRYNWAQIVAGPMLACCVNSPILLGRELWAETRIALFRQSLDVRHAGTYVSHQEPRVAFGQQWLERSPSDIFKQDIAMYPTIIGAEIGDETSMSVLDRGEIPRLRAMNLHNGTLYKWNRPCYGVGGGKPHLRIENRYIGAGPTIVDEMANSVFWSGLMLAMPEEHRGAWQQAFRFQDVRCNFLKAARNGLSNEMIWFGKHWDAGQLILQELLPMAARGLEVQGVPEAEFTPYLQVIADRVASRQTGAQWIVDSLRKLREKYSVNECQLLLTEHLAEHCQQDIPAHLWETPDPRRLPKIPGRNQRVESIMIGTVVTVRDDDLLDLASSLMEWNRFHHLPVENSRGQLRGVISANDIEEFRKRPECNDDSLVEECMVEDIVTVAPQSSLENAEKLMRLNQIGSLPVVHDGRVVGIVTVKDIIDLQRKND